MNVNIRGSRFVVGSSWCHLLLSK